MSQVGWITLFEISKEYFIEGLIYSKPAFQMSYTNLLFHLFNWKKNIYIFIYFLCTNHYSFGYGNYCVCQECFLYKLLMPFSKDERLFQARRMLANMTSLRSPPTWIFPVIPWPLEMVWALLSSSKQEQVYPLISCRNLLINHTCYCWDFDAEEE